MDILAPRERLVALAEQALAVVGDDEPHLQARLLAARASSWELSLDEPGEQAAQRAAELARTHGYQDVEARLLMREGEKAFSEMRLDDARSASVAAHGAFDRLGDYGNAVLARSHASLSILAEGRIDDGEAAVKESLAYARKFHVRQWEHHNINRLAEVALLRCDYQRVDALLEEVQGADNVYTNVLRASRAEMAGDLEQALELAPRPDFPGGIRPWTVPQIIGGLARTYFNAGDEASARRHLAAWADGYERLTPGAGRHAAFSAIDECLPALGDDALLETIYKNVVGTATGRFDPGQGRARDHIRGALALRLGRAEEAEEHYRTGLEWAEEVRFPVEQGRCLQGLAEVAQRRGNRAEAVQLLDRAAALFQDHGAQLYLRQVLAKKDILRA